MIRHWKFIVDTEQYAGGFERELAAYMTGQVAECGMGQEFADRFMAETPPRYRPDFDNLVVFVPDENGFYRPSTLEPTPGWFCNPAGQHFRIGEEKKALKAYKQHEQNRISKQIARLKSFRSSSGCTKQDKEINEEILEQSKLLRKVKNTKVLNERRPAYLSVGIFFVLRPTAKLISFLKTRAARFNMARHDSRFARDNDLFMPPITITGYRLVKVPEPHYKSTSA